MSTPETCKDCQMLDARIKQLTSIINRARDVYWDSFETDPVRSMDNMLDILEEVEE